MKIDSDGNTISLEFEFETDSTLPSFGDASVLVSVKSHGYSGRTSTWVFRDEFKEFYRSLRSLEQVRKGEAKLVSMSAGELELRIYSTDSLGHMAVSGSIASYTYGLSVHSMRFGFSLDPSILADLLKSEEFKNA